MTSHTPKRMLARLPLLFAVLAAWSLAGCSHDAVRISRSATWVAGREAPAFDPDGPPDALRWALERQLSMGLVERDSSGGIRNALADSVGCSRDSMMWTFRLRAGLRFTDGTPVRSSNVREALTAGLGRADHATRAWLLAAVSGVADVRPGRPLPRLGIETKDDRTLVLRLARRDPRLLEKLAIPGVSTPWKRRTGEWQDAVGVGPYRVAAARAERSLTLIASNAVANVSTLTDTLHVRFVVGAPRALSVMRLGQADMIWPLPPGTVTQTLPNGWSIVHRVARPGRRLLLVLRGDVPPLTRLEARQSLASAVNREELLAELGDGIEPIRRWLSGSQLAYDWPRLESRTDRLVRLAEGRSPDDPSNRPLSLHVTLAYDADLSGAAIARRLQGQWARMGHYADLRPLRGAAAASQALAATAAQAQLVESQALLPGAEVELAQLLMPLRGPAVGAFRTGWRTREFDRWVGGGEPAAGFDPDAAQRRLAADRVVLPVAALPWRMAFRNGGSQPRLHPAYGPGWTAVNSPPARNRTR